MKRLISVLLVVMLFVLSGSSVFAADESAGVVRDELTNIESVARGSSAPT